VVKRSNNFTIFRSATLNLLAGRDLYAAHPDQHLDYYKYSPTFALLFAPLAYLPFALAFFCWSLLNALLLWYALDRLLPGRPATLALALLYLEVLFAMQYGQSNSLVTALMILAFVAGDRSGRHAEPGLLDDAVPLHVAQRRLAQLAGAARGDGAAAPAARPGPDALERPGVPAPVSLFAPGLRRALQPPVGAGHVHHRL